MSLEKSLKNFNLKTSFKNMVNLDNSRRLATASATTTTTSTTTTFCESAGSELLQGLLRLFQAWSHSLCCFCLLLFAYLFNRFLKALLLLAYGPTS